MAVLYARKVKSAETSLLLFCFPVANGLLLQITNEGILLFVCSD